MDYLNFEHELTSYDWQRDFIEYEQVTQAASVPELLQSLQTFESMSEEMLSTNPMDAKTDTIEDINALEP